MTDAAPSAEFSADKVSNDSASDAVAKPSWVDELWFRPEGRWWTMMRATILAILTTIAVPTARFALWFALGSGQTQAPSSVPGGVPVVLQTGRFVHPGDAVAVDPLRLLYQEKTPSQSISEVRSLLQVQRSRLIVLTASDVDSAALTEVARICREQQLVCVQLEAIIGEHGGQPRPLPYASIVSEPNQVAEKEHGLYLYDENGNLLWHCPPNAISNSLHDLTTIAQAISAASQWHKDRLQPIAVVNGTVPPQQAKKPKPPAPPKTVAMPEAVRLTAIDGLITDALNDQRGWSPVRESWFVKDYPKSSGKKPTLLVFWATWCGPCMHEFPLLDQLREQYRQSVLFVGLADERDNPEARRRIAEAIKPYNFRLHYLLKDSAVGRRIFNIADLPLPAFALFDENGKLVAKQFGNIGDTKNAESLRRSLDSVTVQKKAAAD